MKTGDLGGSTTEGLGKFLGVSPEGLHALGCLVVAAARLERTIHSIAIDLWIPPNRKGSDQLLREIRQASEAGRIPGHARLEPSELADWTHEAKKVLNLRHNASHSAAAQRGAQSVFVHIRSGSIEALDAVALRETARQIALMDKRGSRLNYALRHNPRPGVYLPNAVWNDEWIPMCATDDGGPDMTRPTTEELDEWWQHFGPIPRL